MFTVTVNNFGLTTRIMVASAYSANVLYHDLVNRGYNVASVEETNTSINYDTNEHARKEDILNMLYGSF